MSLFTRRKSPEQLVKLLKDALTDPSQLAKPGKDGKVRVLLSLCLCIAVPTAVLTRRAEWCRSWRR